MSVLLHDEYMRNVILGPQLASFRHVLWPMEGRGRDTSI